MDAEGQTTGKVTSYEYNDRGELGCPRFLVQVL